MSQTMSHTVLSLEEENTAGHTLSAPPFEPPVRTSQITDPLRDNSASGASSAHTSSAHIGVAATVLTLAWIGACAALLFMNDPVATLAAMSPHQVATLVGSLIAPIAFIWLTALYLRGVRQNRESNAAITRAVHALFEPDEATRQRLSGAAQKLQEQVQALREASLTVDAQLRALEDRHERHLTRLDTLATETARRGETMAALLGEKETALAQLSDRITNRAQLIEDTINQASHNFYNAADQAASRAVSTTDAFDKRIEELLGAVDRSGTVTNALGAKLLSYIEKLSEATEHARHEAENVGLEFEKHAQTMNDSAEVATQRGKTMADLLGARSDSLSSLSSQLDNQTAEITERLDSHGAVLDHLITSTGEKAREFGDQFTVELNAIIARVEDGLAHTRDQAQQVREAVTSNSAAMTKSIGDAAENAIERVENARTAFAVQAEAMTDKTGDALERMEAHYKRQTDRLEELLADLASRAETSSEQVESAGETLRTRIEETLSSSEEIIHKTLDLQNSLGAGLDRLDQQADAVATQIRQIGDELQERVNALENVSGEAREQFADVSEMLETQRAVLNEFVNRSIERIETVAESAGAGAHSAEASVRTVASQLASASATLNDNIRTIDNAAAKVQEGIVSAQHNLHEQASQVAQLTRALRQQYDDLSQHSAQTVGILAENRDHARAQSEEILQDTRKSQNQLNTLSTILARQAMELRDSATQATNATDSAVERLARQAQTLLGVAEEIKQRAEKVEEQQSLRLRDSFVKSASFVIEALHGLAVDLSRIFDSEVPDHVLKRFLHGERHIFSRRLVRLGSRQTQRDIREKFDTDHEFQTHVSRYLTQFEKLIGEAEAADPESTLTAALMSSDSGKLYLLLAQSLKRLG